MRSTAALVTALVALFFLTSIAGFAQRKAPKTLAPAAPKPPTEVEIASRFAPVFYQSVGDSPRGDYITNFDFDGDWQGDNNWKSTDDQKIPLRGYVYYSVSETQTHYFIHYAAFHPRDYKGGEKKGVAMSDMLKGTHKVVGKADPKKMIPDVAIAHENDMEGALLVVLKSGNDLSKSHLVFVETLHHNQFSKYVAAEPHPSGTELVKTDGDRPLLNVEAKGHGIERYTGNPNTSPKKVLVYRFGGKAGDPAGRTDGLVDYDLTPIKSTLWPKAVAGAAKNTTFGTFSDYGDITIDLVGAKGVVGPKKLTVGSIGSAFLGKKGGENMARPPWGWFDMMRKDALGSWFFDPAKIVKRDFNQGEAFSTAYVRLPFWAVK